jgi:lipoprotein NlpI
LVNKGLKCKQSDWPYQVLEYFAGKITEQELILLAGSDPQKTCEVHCYVGYVYKFTGDTAQAMEHFQVSIETNQKELVVYTLSQIELDKLN